MTVFRHRYRRSKPSTRRVCPGGVSVNRGFDYQQAVRVVRPELAAKLANPQTSVQPVSSGKCKPLPVPPQSDADGTAATQRLAGPTPDQRRLWPHGVHDHDHS